LSEEVHDGRGWLVAFMPSWILRESVVARPAKPAITTTQMYRSGHQLKPTENANIELAKAGANARAKLWAVAMGGQ
jgi:hypothetical protein